MNRDLSVMTPVPLVVGGVVGVEFATILSGLGAEVTLLVRGECLLRNSELFAADMVTRCSAGASTSGSEPNCLQCGDPTAVDR